MHRRPIELVHATPMALTIRRQATKMFMLRQLESHVKAKAAKKGPGPRNRAASGTQGVLLIATGVGAPGRGGEVWRCGAVRIYWAGRSRSLDRRRLLVEPHLVYRRAALHSSTPSDAMTWFRYRRCRFYGSLWRLCWCGRCLRVRIMLCFHAQVSLQSASKRASRARQRPAHTPAVDVSISLLHLKCMYSLRAGLLPEMHAARAVDPCAAARSIAPPTTSRNGEGIVWQVMACSGWHS